LALHAIMNDEPQAENKPLLVLSYAAEPVAKQ
jgi:hypothetical protein